MSPNLRYLAAKEALKDADALIDNTVIDISSV